MMKRTVLALALAGSLGATMAAEQQLTEEQTAAAFAKADGDGNATVSLAEARKFGITARAFTKANPDRDGSLDKKEFAAALSLQFNRANPDQDGTLDWKEARKAGIKSKKTFDAANPDQDGTLDPAEFVAALLLQAK